MLRTEQPVRFLLRGSTILLGMLILWWLVLRHPLLFLLRVSESAALQILVNTDSITVDSVGDWRLRIPVQDSGGKTIRTKDPVKFRAVEFTIPASDVVLFTYALPVYWAIVLAAPLGKSTIRAFAWGTAAVFLVEVLSLLVHAEIVAYAATAQLHFASTGLAAWLREYGTRLVVGVIPFAAPVLAAIAFHRDLRLQIFSPQRLLENPAEDHERKPTYEGKKQVGRKKRSR